MKIPEDALGRTFKCVRCGIHMKSGEANVQGMVPAPATVASSEGGALQAESQPSPSADPPNAQAPIGQLLIDAKMITEEQLADALSKQRTQGGKTFEILIALGYLDKDILHDFLSRQPGIATIDLSRCDIGSDLIALVPKRLAVESLVLPIDQLGKLLTVAMACPLDVATISALETCTGLRVKAMLCKLEDIHVAVQKYYPERSRFEMSASSFDNILGKSEGTKEKVEAKVEAWGGIFPGKEQLDALTQAISDEPGLDKVALLLLKEPVLAAFFIRVANSDLYGMQGQTESLPMAVAVLGKEAILSFLKEHVPPGDDKVTVQITPLIAQSRVTAHMMQQLALETGTFGQHLAYTVGMVSGLGRIALSTISAMKYKRVKPHLYGSELAEAELRYFTMDHASAAGAILDAWGFPVTIVRAVRYSNMPKEAGEGEGLSGMLSIAIALACGPLEKMDEILVNHGESMQSLNLNQDMAQRILSLVRPENTVKGESK